MQHADTRLGLIRERGTWGLPLTRRSPLRDTPDLSLRASARLSTPQGAMTPGTTPESVEGMRRAKIDRRIDDLRHARCRWTPARRVHIPKKRGTRRPLGRPTWTDTRLPEGMRSLLEASCAPQCSAHSHGFRPGRGCCTALRAVPRGGTGTTWWIEGESQGGFDTLDQAVLWRTLGEQIHDHRCLGRMRRLRQAGYVEDWRDGASRSGTPHGGVASPR